VEFPLRPQRADLGELGLPADDLADHNHARRVLDPAPVRTPPAETLTSFAPVPIERLSVPPLSTVEDWTTPPDSTSSNSPLLTVKPVLVVPPGMVCIGIFWALSAMAG